MEVKQLIADLEANVDSLPAGSLAPDTVLGDHPGWDSLAILIVISMADENYGVSLTGEEIRRSATPVDLCQVIASKTGK